MRDHTLTGRIYVCASEHEEYQKLRGTLTLKDRRQKLKKMRRGSLATWWPPGVDPSKRYHRTSGKPYWRRIL